MSIQADEGSLVPRLQEYLLSRWNHLRKKAGWSFFTIIFVVVLNFFLFRAMPGDPARQDKNPNISSEAKQAVRERFGLDKPVMNCIKTLNPIVFGSCTINPADTQFFIYVKNLLTGELGTSYFYSRPVTDILKERLWNTVLLIGAGQILSIIIGTILGILGAWRARTAVDQAALITSLVAWSLPTFWLGIILAFWGSNHGFPIGGKATPGISSYPWPNQVGDFLWHLVLPTIVYTIVYMGEYTLVMRSSLLDVLSEDYILTAKAKGLTTFQVLKDHALKNGMLPLVTIIAINLGYTVAGIVQIESVFSWPGLGGAIFEAVDRRDYPILQGVFLLLAISVILANWIADITYSYLDPRVLSE